MYIARFKKVSEAQFEKDCMSIFDAYEPSWYEGIELPKRATKGSAGYDFKVPMDVTIKPGAMVRIPLGIRVKMEEGYVLCMHPRSSMGFKYQMALANTTGVIDSDYYGAENEGHIMAAVVNRGDKVLELKKGDRFVQGIFLNYFLAEEEDAFEKRTGGYGSSGK